MSGEEFRAARIGLGVTQAELAGAFGVSPRTIRNLEQSEVVAGHYSLALEALLLRSVAS